MKAISPVIRCLGKESLPLVEPSSTEGDAISHRPSQEGMGESVDQAGEGKHLVCR